MDPFAAAKGNCLKKLIDAGLEARKSYDAISKEIDQFIDSQDYAFMYNATDPDLSFYARVSLMGQAVDMFLPQIVSANPHRIATVRNQNDQLTVARASIVEEYLNRLPNETGLYEENVMAGEQGLAHGRGVMWTGFNPRTKLVQTVFDSDCNLVLDPDAKSLNRLHWVARKREKPRWELLELYPDQGSSIASLKGKTPGREASSKAELLCYYEIYMRVGLHRYSEASYGAEETGDQPKKYVISEDGKLLFEGPWELPWFVDNAWPCEVWDPRGRPSHIWPRSVLEPGLGHQKALNYLYTDYVSKFRASAKIMMAYIRNSGVSISEEGKSDLFNINSRFPILELEGQGLDDPDINKIFQQLKIDPGTSDFVEAYGIIKREFEEHTGLYSIFHAGHQPSQSRSAKDAEMKDRNSRTRLDVLQMRFERFQSKIARKEAIAARFLHTPEEITNILGPEQGQLWGQIMPPQEASMDPMAVNFEQFFKETDYSIETGSIRSRNIDQKIDALQEIMQTTVPVQMASMDLNEKALAYETMAEYHKTLGNLDNLVAQEREMAANLKNQALMMAQMQQAMAMQPAADPAGAAPVPASPVVA